MEAGTWRLSVFGVLLSLAGGILLSVQAKSAILPSTSHGDKIQNGVIVPLPERGGSMVPCFRCTPSVNPRECCLPS
jgi:hypothetical protein